MRKKPPKGIRYFSTGPWPVFIGFTTCPKVFKREMKRLGVEDVDFYASRHANATTHHFTKDNQNIWLITMAPYSRKCTQEQYAALIAHEAVHVIQGMGRELAGGRSLGEEAEAYLVQQIVQESLQVAWKSNMARRGTPK